jgi:Aldehyde dehydrogenase family
VHAIWRNGLNAAARNRSEKMDAQPSMHLYEVRPRRDNHGVDLISDVVSFGALWYAGPNAASDAIDYAKFHSRTQRGDPRLRSCWQHNRNARAQGRFQTVVKIASTSQRFLASLKAAMVGINIGVPASMAWFPFCGWRDSFFGDLHMQGKKGVQFFTQQKVTTTRWFAQGEENGWSAR